MALPAYHHVDLALLVELVRLGKPVRPLETYDKVTAHFPELTEEDRTLVRRDGRTRVWTNMIQWARDNLRKRGLLADAGPGLWATNENGRRFLHQLLQEHGVSDADAFIESERHLQDVLGPGWATTARPRPRAQAAESAGREATVELIPSTPAAVSAPIGLAEAQQAEIASVRQALIERLLAMADYEFENAVGRILDALGFRGTEVVGRPGDGGVDVRTALKNELVSATVAVQVKRQRANVGPKEISYLRDRWGRRMDKLLFVTTSDYTVGAREVANEEGAKPVQLVTGDELADLMIRNRIGVSTHAVERFEVDEEFFQG
jgi:restriction endonuclease Mrr